MKLLASAVALAAALTAAQVNAAPAFTLGGYTGDIVIKFQNWESFTAGPVQGSENFGILSITSIQAGDGSGQQLWVQGQSGAELTGVFRDITVLSSTVTAGGDLNVKSTGGLLDLYINNAGSFTAAGGATQGTAGYAACPITLDCYNGISNVGGDLFLSLAFASGIDPANPAVTVDGDFDGATFPTTGDAAGYLNVTGGTYAENFDNDGFVTAFGLRDMFFQNDFCPNGTPTCTPGGPVGNWELLSDDPVRAQFIPEPGSLALLGIALLGFAGLRRRLAA